MPLGVIHFGVYCGVPFSLDAGNFPLVVPGEPAVEPAAQGLQGAARNHEQEDRPRVQQGHPRLPGNYFSN